MKRLFLGVLGVFIAVLSLFASNLATTKDRAVFHSLYGYKIFLDPGHGGYDPGSSRAGVEEKNINMDIASAVFEKAVDGGMTAEISRSGDYDLSGIFSSNHKVDDLHKRVALINSSQADLLISLHLNAIDDPDVHGPMVYYRHLDASSEELARNIQETLNELTGLYKIIHPERYYLFRQTAMPAVLVECGFLSNADEREKLTDETYQDRLAEAIIAGIYRYLTK